MLMGDELDVRDMCDEVAPYGPSQICDLKVMYWPLFESDICDRIIAAPGYPVPQVWINYPTNYGAMSHTCDTCDVSTTESSCWVCGSPLYAVD